MYKSASDGSEDVSYTQDIGQNLDKIDAAVGFQIVTSSTRPSSPFPGKPITESDTSYRTYFSNGTSPASASWVEIPNSSATYNSNLALAAGRTISFGGDVTVSRAAAGRLAITGTNAGLVIGSATYQNTLTAAAATVANTTTETVVGTFTIPANDAVVGATYRARLIANVSFLASAQLTWRARLGGVAGTQLAAAGPTTLSGTAQTNKESIVEVDLVCVSTGASGTWFTMLAEQRNTTQTGSLGDIQLGSSDGTITRDTTASNAFVITAQWAAASASNTLTARCVMERVA
jgi:hypothetical protein